MKFGTPEFGTQLFQKKELSSYRIDAIGNHTVLFEDGIYKMYYSYRKVTKDYRTNHKTAYKLGYAISTDGVKFTPRNDLFEVRGKREQWEIVMNAYPRIFDYKKRRYLFYNGNGFGKSGFGYAELIK